ncbi:hypothetical protein RchiOBHm_Chr5g0002871 [Rosa chinensis]|uniref:Uncharacterized protein n=1 Tax=Rosa chinensis TaxID=74649 RepID=A0A2P6Q2M1_ROSCH|nr:hypothetical protein RchiOBHm_Chr5g0002871 [Rosa chinensis]
MPSLSPLLQLIIPHLSNLFVISDLTSPDIKRQHHSDILFLERFFGMFRPSISVIFMIYYTLTLLALPLTNHQDARLQMCLRSSSLARAGND